MRPIPQSKCHDPPGFGHQQFSTELFERYARAEKALLPALVEMVIQVVSTRKVTKITEELVGHSFSASSISAIVKILGDDLAAVMERRRAEPFAYLVLDARYEKMRVAHVIRSQAVMIAIGMSYRSTSLCFTRKRSKSSGPRNVGSSILYSMAIT